MSTDSLGNENIDMAVGYSNGYKQGYEQGKKDSVKHGHWIVYEGQSNTRVACSECEHPVNYFCDSWQDAKHCPNCGAKMDGDINA